MFLPTNIFSAFSGNNLVISLPISLSYRITSHSFINSIALIVSDFGSPGPAPQIKTFPVFLFSFSAVS